jgi:hypothetical protein
VKVPLSARAVAVMVDDDVMPLRERVEPASEFLVDLV